GYAENVPTGRGLEGGEQFGLRAQVLHNAGDWSFLGGVDYSKDDMQGHARVPVLASSTPPAFATLVNNLRAGLSVRQSFSSADNYQKRENWGLTGRAQWSGAEH